MRAHFKAIILGTFLLTLTWSRAARAEHEMEVVVDAFIVVGLIDVTLGVVDTGYAISGSQLGTAYGVTETVIAAPQALLGVGLVAMAIEDGDDAAFLGASVIYFGATAMLLAHGIYTIGHQDTERAPIAIVPDFSGSGGGVSVIGRF